MLACLRHLSRRSPSLRLPLPLAASLRPPATALRLPSFRPFSGNAGGGNGDGKCGSWKFSPDDASGQSVFGSEDGDLSGIEPSSAPASGREVTAAEEGDVFGHVDEEEFGAKGAAGAEDDWLRGEGEYKPWSFGGEREEVEKVFDVGDVGPEGLPGVMVGEGELEDEEKRAEAARLEKEEQELKVALKGPNRAFGDLISASGITESMLDSLIALKDLENIEGLPPLSEIEDIRLAKAEKKSTRAEIERKKQEEIAKTYVRQVDDKGRAYGTGRRKCSIARVWIQPGDGQFVVNDKQFDVYFPLLDHRADLLRPFTETKTLGRWDVSCTVKGGGVSGQVGAIRLGISRALQNWEPGLRPYLRSVGFLTRDARVVERKKPGKAKARKSFQWVKR